MAQRANLIATYNANPTLQKQYTLPQYLALFDFSQTPTTPTSTPTPTPVTPGIPNIINQNINQGGGGGGGGGAPPPGPTDPYAGLGYSSANFGLGNTAINKDAVFDYEADAYKVGRTLPGQLSKFGVGIFNAFKNIPTPFNLVRKGLEFAKQNAIQKEKEKEAQLAAITRDIARSNKAAGTGGYQAGYGGDFMGGAGRGTGMGAADKGGSDSMGSFQDGGRVYLYNRLK